jgi:tRNA-2-methylthio-N6-dimethylallyladenosine synthase
LNKRFHIKTMGCQMNEYDSDFLAQSLIQNGFSPENEVGQADVILINTCAVRAKPEQKACSFLGRMADLKERNPELIVGMIGCLAQMKGKELMKRFPLLDFIMGPRELGQIIDVVGEIYDSRQKIAVTGLKGAPPSPVNYPGYFQNQTSGFISIMEGCNNFCSYCVVPYVRGREHFRPPEDILKEAEHLLSEGVREITLLGQNVNSYTWDDSDNWNFSSLLHAMDNLEDLSRLRFTTSHPKDLSDDLLGCFQKMDKLAGHIHLPFQAGSSRILKLMRRGYTREEYLEIIERLKTSKEGIAITSDVMVGFPGETEEDFLLTLDLMQQVEFDSLFSFKYSDREGTPAAKMPDKISKDVKVSRLQRLQDLQNSITLKKNRHLEGRQLTVLVEGTSKKGGQLMGRTGSNKVVNFDGDNHLVGKLVEVTIQESYLNSLKGELTGF